MRDENGNEIDLDSIDAIGRLPDGRFDVWLHNDRRVVTDDPEAFEVWQGHVRSQSGRLAARNMQGKKAVLS
jgi:hypothetical protein